MKHRSATMLYVIAAPAAIWGAALAQRPAAEEGTLLDKLKQIEERLTSVEKALARQVETDAKESPLAVSTRLDRLENRVTTREAEGSRYRSGAPAVGTLSLLESRRRLLESEVARLWR